MIKGIPILIPKNNKYKIKYEINDKRNPIYNLHTNIKIKYEIHIKYTIK